MENHELGLARDFVQYTDRNIFLTGKAGTGKTTFLHNLKGNTAKRMVVTAPTGVAAINAGGVTLHSFFQLPFGPFIPGSDAYQNNRQRFFRFSKEKKRIIKSLDLLVIDEISMVRADLLDSVDAVLRQHRRSEQPFGGVQVLMIGDLHQLSPVARPEEWRHLQQYYASIYFFSSHVLSRTKMFTIELKHIYRQSDTRFIKLLNQVRDNRLDAAAIKMLNQRYIHNYTPAKNQGYITLTTHNRNADDINRNKLAALTDKQYYFDAEIDGDFPEHIYPAPKVLILKKDSQVMFLRNDASEYKRYFNGKIGKIKHITNQEIHIVCPGESEDIKVEPVKWENIKYTLNQESKEIKEDIIGMFKQYPLKLAWAITIHKSQGLTFDQAVIDAQSAFTHGQVYVALSRCKTFEGMVLSSPIPTSGVEIDDAILNFDNLSRQNSPSEKQLQTDKIYYQQQILLTCFDFQVLHNRLDYFMRLLRGNSRVVQVSGVSNIGRLQEMAWEDIFKVSQKFKQQLDFIFVKGNLPETDPYILERIGKASGWFQDKFALIFDDLMQKLYLETDNKELGKKLTNTLNNLKQEITVKLAGIKSCQNRFSPAQYLCSVSKAEIDFMPAKIQKPRMRDYMEADIKHPELFQQLKDWRNRKAKEQDLKHFQILHQRILIQITVNLPDNATDLQKIKGVGRQTLAKYGAEILAMVCGYRKKHGIKSVIRPVFEIKTELADTKQISFDMFKKGLSISRIAAERGLVESTIQGHLCSFVEKGNLDLNELLSSEKQSVIKTAIAKVSDHALRTIKEILGNDYSYGEIKLMLAHQSKQNQQPH